MIDNKEDIIRILGETYEQEKVIVAKDVDRYFNLKLKLIQTTEQFARSFEYELPREHNLKGKLKRLIQKIIRKLARFLTKPYAEQMLKFQEEVCELAGDIIREMEEENGDNDLIRLTNMVKKEINDCKRENSQYKKKYDEQLDLIKELVDRLDNSEKVKEAYGKTLGEHENAIYKLASDYNETANMVLGINDYLFRGEDVAVKSYSQAGEDAIVSYILNVLGEKKGCSYLDIGCNRYNELNNTYYFYKRGIRGVLVDANPQFIKEIQENRPEDIVLNVGVGIKSGEKLTFYVMNGDGLSSFNKESIDAAMKETAWLKIEQEIEVPILTINEIYKKYFLGAPSIVSIDVEGDELAILESIDMKKYRPLIYIIETIEYREKLDLDNKRIDIVDFMQSKGYREYAFTGINSIFVDGTAI